MFCNLWQMFSQMLMPFSGVVTNAIVSIFVFNIQSPLGFATMGLAAALGLATATPLTDLRQYINSDLGFSDLEI